MKSFFGNAQSAHVSVDLLSGYLDNQVTPEERARIEQHVRGCATCQAELQSLHQTVAMLHALPRVPVPRAFTLSEVQVGLAPRRSTAATPTWYGGLARLAGVTAALVVIAGAVFAFLHNSPFGSSGQVALAPKPPAAAVPSASPSATARSLVAPAAPAAGAATEAPAAGQPEAAPSPTIQAFGPTTEPAPPAAAPAPGSAGKNAADTVPAPTESIAPDTAIGAAESAAAGTAASAAASEEPATAESPSPSVAPSTEAPAMTLSAPTEGVTPTEGAAIAAGAGEALQAPTTAANLQAPSILSRSAGGTPPPTESPQPTTSITSTLPAGAGLAYADGKSVWALDGRTGGRKLLDVAGATMPVVSSDRAWIAFWVVKDGSGELWVVAWDGTDGHMLLSESALPKDDLGSDYSARRFVYDDLRWIPGAHTLLFRTRATPQEATGQPKEELWSIDVPSGNLHKVADLGLNSGFTLSPDGKLLALLKRGTPDNPKGSLSIAGSDGSNPRLMLQLPTNPNGYGYESQVSWLPDSRSLWLGAPITGEQPADPITRIDIYRVPVHGKAQAVGHVDAPDTSWSPDGQHLAYLRPAADTDESRQLFLAGADGSSPRLYTTIQGGTFARWAPDGAHFVYGGDGQAYLGATGQPGQVLPALRDVLTARWVTSHQLLYISNRPGASVLVSYTIGGQAANIATLPEDVSFDVIPGG